MKTTLTAISLVILGFTIGCAYSRIIDPVRVAAAIDLSACSSTFQPGGPSTPCGQYVLQVNSGRGLGRFVLARATTPIDPSTVAVVQAGGSITFQDSEPTPRSSSTFTITATEP